MKNNCLLFKMLISATLMLSVQTSNSQSITVPSEVIGKNTVFEISFSGAPGTANDWIGLFPLKGDISSSIGHYYLDSQTNGTLLFQSPVESGIYDFRMYQENQLICRSEPFVVREALMLNQEFNSTGIFHADFSDNDLDDWAVDIKIAPDNMIVVAGAVHSGDTSTWDVPIVNFVVARFHPNGQPDMSFGVNGKVVTPIPGIEAYDVRAMVVQSDGKIIVGGSAMNYGISQCGWNPWTGSFILVRYDINGNLDNTFGNNGIVLTNFTLPGEYAGFSSDELRCLALQPDGKILAGGRGLRCSTATYRCSFARYNTNGSLDDSFSDDGKLVFVHNTNDWQWVEAIAPPVENGDGSFYIATIRTEWIIFGSNENYIYKIDANGNFVPGFGINGLVVEPLPGLGGSQFPQSISIGPDGKLYLVGCTHGAGYIWIMKKDPVTGDPAAGFGDNGLVVHESLWGVVPIGSTFHDNMLYVGTYIPYGSWSVVRFYLDGAFDVSYGWPLVFTNEQNEELKAMAMLGEGDFVIAGSGQYPAFTDQDFLVANLANNTTHYLNNQTIGGNSLECFGSNENIYVRNFEVEAGTSVELIAANKILILNNSKVEAGGIFHARITTNNTYCAKSNPIVEVIDEILLPESLILPESHSGLFRYYPNPTQGILNLEFAVQPGSNKIGIEILSMMGNTLKTIELQPSPVFQFDLNDLPRGVYVVRVLIDGKTDFAKIILQ